MIRLLYEFHVCRIVTAKVSQADAVRIRAHLSLKHPEAMSLGDAAELTIILLLSKNLFSMYLVR